MSRTQTETYKENFKLPRDPSAAMQETMNIIDELRAVYVKENEALEASNTNEFMALQDEKLLTARRYQLSIETLLSRKDELKNANPAAKEKLRHMQKEFSAIAEQNRKALKRMSKAVEALGATVRRAAKETLARDNTYNYSETGEVKNRDSRVVSTGISETA